MTGKIRQRLSYANVVATLALFVALGGSSYAAVQLKKNSVRSKHIKNGQVKRADLARNAVKSDKVKDASLRAGDFMPGQLPAGSKGATGPAGAVGPQGPQGETGAPGISGGRSFRGGPTLNLPNCTASEIHRAPITVQRTSRLFVRGVVSHATTGSAASMAVRVYDGADQLLGSQLNVLATGDGGENVPIEAEGVLMKDDVPTVLAPGVYSLRLSVTPGGGCQGATSDFVGWSLTYLVIGDSD